MIAKPANSEGTERYMNQLVEVTTLLSLSEKKLRPWMGGSVANICSRFLHPIATYRFYLFYGGLGCSNLRLLMPWINFSFLALGLCWVNSLFDFKMFFLLVARIGQINLLLWSLSALAIVSLFVLLLFCFAHLITGIGILHGTFLRGMNREHIQGRVNLEGTGKTNFILRKIGSPKS